MGCEGLTMVATHRNAPAKLTEIEDTTSELCLEDGLLFPLRQNAASLRVMTTQSGATERSSTFSTDMNELFGFPQPCRG
eukprot:2186897-Amphidinium_carterae.1